MYRVLLLLSHSVLVSFFFSNYILYSVGPSDSHCSMRTPVEGIPSNVTAYKLLFDDKIDRFMLSLYFVFAGAVAGTPMLLLSGKSRHVW